MYIYIIEMTIKGSIEAALFRGGNEPKTKMRQRQNSGHGLKAHTRLAPMQKATCCLNINNGPAGL